MLALDSRRRAGRRLGGWLAVVASVAFFGCVEQHPDFVEVSGTATGTSTTGIADGPTTTGLPTGDTTADSVDGSSSGDATTSMVTATSTTGEDTGGTDETGGSSTGEQCTVEVCDGIDNDCDDVIDEDCECLPDDVEACYTGEPDTQGVGICTAGTRTCDAEGMWGPCEGEVLPAVDTCNALDDDCDGGVDEDFGTVQCGVGICQVSAEECVDGQLVECVPGTPDAAETCNGIDDTCDGMIDEGCDCVNDDTQPCYSGPANTEGVGVCLAGVQTCVDGAWGACENDVVPTSETCDAEDDDCDGVVDDGDPGGGNGCQTGLSGVCGLGTTECNGGMIECIQTTFPSNELCDGLDNDCDTGVDEGNPEGGQQCSTGLLGVCATGETLCQSGTLSCDQTVFSSPESCDGLDNDCDGSTDENNPEGGQACNTGLMGVCAAGLTACNGGALECQQQTMASAESCDGLDNDCDGSVDEGNPGSGAACNTGQPGVCSEGTTSCEGGALVCNPNTTASAETCDGLDNDCDGSVDEGNPGGGMACSTGQPGVCDAGTTACQNGGIVCNPNNNPVAEQCDNLDNDCDGVVDEGDPGGGAFCDTGLLGVCADGTTHCISGVIECTQDTASGPEVCDDGLDNDCNGTVDNGCCTQTVSDGTFEGGTPSAIWTEMSTNFGTPLCSVATCPNGGGSGPHGGSWWAWFGGSQNYELGSISQSITIPSGTATLTFWLEIPACAGSGVDTFDISIDGMPVFSTDNSDPACEATGYVQHSVDVSGFADGGVHTLEFVGETFGMGGAFDNVTNFFVDDVTLQSCI